MICVIRFGGNCEKSRTSNLVKLACENSGKRKQDMSGTVIIIESNRIVSRQRRVDPHKLIAADEKPRLTKRVLASKPHRG